MTVAGSVHDLSIGEASGVIEELLQKASSNGATDRSTTVITPKKNDFGASARLGMAPRAEESHEMGRLPQFFADRIGWPELAATVADVFATLTPAERETACIFGQNYGQAGAIDFYGPALGLPKALSAHNSYFLWGPRGCSGDVVVVIDGDREDLEEVFESVTLATVYTSHGACHESCHRLR